MNEGESKESSRSRMAAAPRGTEAGLSRPSSRREWSWGNCELIGRRSRLGVRPTRAVHSFSQGSHRVSQILSCGTYEGQCTVGPHLGQLAGSSAASRHSTRAAARHDHSTSQSVSQLFHGPAPRSDPSPTSDHSLLLKGRLRCRPLSAVLTASCAQGSRPRGFLSGTQFGGTGPRHWYAVGTPRAQETGR